MPRHAGSPALATTRMNSLLGIKTASSNPTGLFAPMKTLSPSLLFFLLSFLLVPLHLAPFLICRLLNPLPPSMWCTLFLKPHAFLPTPSIVQIHPRCSLSRTLTSGLVSGLLCRRQSLDLPQRLLPSRRQQWTLLRHRPHHPTVHSQRSRSGYARSGNG